MTCFFDRSISRLLSRGSRLTLFADFFEFVIAKMLDAHE
jgi:hypothetical protein